MHKCLFCKHVKCGIINRCGADNHIITLKLEIAVCTNHLFENDNPFVEKEMKKVKLHENETSDM